jgi:hypothetical protein
MQMEETPEGDPPWKTAGACDGFMTHHVMSQVEARVLILRSRRHSNLHPSTLLGTHHQCRGGGTVILAIGAGG